MAKKPKKPKTITQEQFSRWSPEHQQRALNDRRTRIRIEDKALPAEWLQRRQQARFNKTPITEGSGTTYGDLEQQRKYLEPLTFGEGDRQLADRQSNLAAARQRDADWFTQYRNQVSEAQQRAIGAQQAAVTGNQQLIQSATDASNASRDSIVKQLQDRAAQLGQSSQAPEYQQLADAATAARNAQMVNTGQRQIANAAIDVGSATNGVTVAGLKDLEAQGYRDRQSGALDQDKKDYGSKKDAWRAKFIDDAISEARKQVLEDRAFGATQADRAADNARADAALKDRVKSGRSSRKIQRDRLREQQRAAREREALARERAAKQDSGGNKSDNRTTLQNRTAKSEVSKASSWASRLRSSGWSQSAIRSAMIQGMSVPKSGSSPAYTVPSLSKDAVNTALDIVYRGYIGPANYRIWVNGGYNPASWGWKVKRKGR